MLILYFLWNEVRPRVKRRESTRAVRHCKGDLRRPPLHFPPRVPPLLVLPSQLEALQVIYSRQGKEESEGGRKREIQN